MTPEAKMATLQRNVEMFEPSIQAATTKIKQLGDITSLITKTYGEDFSAMIPATKEDADVFKKAMAAGWEPTVDILQKYGKYFDVSDWNALVNAKQKAKETEYKPPVSYQEYQLAGGQEGTGKTYNEFITTQKAPTAAQQTLSGYAARIEQSNPILTNLEGYISGMSYANYKLQSFLPSSFQSSDFQQYNQASKNFINSVLRRESGAAIAQSEFDNAQKQYLPMPGDSEATLTQKRQNRDLIFANFKQGSGGAYSSVEELLSGNVSGEGESEVYVAPDGTEYTKGEDGLYYPK
jgi:hypothetical protein